jgi:simple sugar transport system permease protein
MHFFIPRKALYLTFIGIFLFILLIIVFSADDPFKAIFAFFIGPWQGIWFAGNTLDGICLLLTASLGAAASFSAGCFNLGGEGQIYAGGFAAAYILLQHQSDNLVAAFLAALAAGGIIGAISGILKRYAATNEIITSFLLSNMLTPIIDYLLSGPFRDPSGSLLATKTISQLPRILPPSNLSISFILAFLLIITGHIFSKKTIFGYRLKIAAASPAFAHYAGIDANRYWIPAMALSGALSGIAGFFAVTGTYGRCHEGFSGGLGWNAIAVALIARNRPLFLIPAAFIYGALNAGTRSAMLASGLQLEAAAFIQAAALLYAAAGFFRRRGRARANRHTIGRLKRNKDLGAGG